MICPRHRESTERSEHGQPYCWRCFAEDACGRFYAVLSEQKETPPVHPYGRRAGSTMSRMALISTCVKSLRFADAVEMERTIQRIRQRLKLGFR